MTTPFIWRSESGPGVLGCDAHQRQATMHPLYRGRSAGGGAKALGDFPSPGAPFSSDGGRPHIKGRPVGEPGALAHVLAPGGGTWRCTDGHGVFRSSGGIGPVGSDSIRPSRLRGLVPSRRNLAHFRQLALTSADSFTIRLRSSCSTAFAR
jgi:hypothetical protein